MGSLFELFPCHSRTAGPWGREMWGARDQLTDPLSSSWPTQHLFYSFKKENLMFGVVAFCFFGMEGW